MSRPGTVTEQPFVPADVSDRRRRGARRAVEVGLCLFCAALPLSIAGANIGWGVILAALLAYAACGGEVPLEGRHSPLERPLWIFLALSLASSAAGVDPAHSLKFFHQDAHKVWLYILLSVALTLEFSPVALAALALGFAAAALIGIAQSVPSFFGDLSQWDRIRAHAFVHPVTYGEQMCVAVLGASCFLIRPPSFWSPGTVRKAAGVILPITVFALLLSNTRGALLACAGGLFGVCLMVRRLRAKALWLIPILGVLFLAAEWMRPDRSVLAETMGWHRPATERSGQMMRVYLWSAALEIGREHPLTGVGHNNYRKVLPRHWRGEFEGRGGSWGTAHNLYLHHFAERGLLGLGALLLLLGTFWVRAWWRAYRMPDAWNLWAFGTATAFMLMNMTEVALQVEILWMLVFFVWICSEVRFRREAAAHASK